MKFCEDPLFVTLVFILVLTIIFYIIIYNTQNNNIVDVVKVETFTDTTNMDSVLTVNDNFQLSTLSFPKGMIMPYYNVKTLEHTNPNWRNNKSNLIPYGWAMCDGENGTPDLRGRFVVGSGEKYKFGNNYGTDTKVLTTNELPSHDHSYTFKQASCGNYFNPFSWGDNPISCDGAPRLSSCPDANLPGQISHSTKNTFGNSLTASGKPFNNNPPFYAMIYIMKII